MDIPPEIITMEAFATLWLIVCGLWTAGWLARAGLALKRRDRPVAFPFLMAAAGPLAWGLWSLYRARIAYDPATGVAGMHRVSVLLTNLAIFLGAGLVIGILAAFALRRPAPATDAPEK
ncbi:MAG: hypothetical protein GF320_21165 [Armatimonadia bacterium]|nr:hypothetical protein [Armatimonadia bacterium]